jgi:ubiquinone/menaquinone biosynthesis C-methylase UbiE
MGDRSKDERYQKCQAIFQRWYPGFKDAGQRYQEILHDLVDRQTFVLDLGCGRMSLAAEQIGRAGLSVGLDPSLPDLIHNRDVTYRVGGSGEELPFASSSLDLIVSQWTVEHLAQPQVVFNEMARVLRPGGRVVVFTTNANNYIPLVSRIMPDQMQEVLIERLLRRPSHETFPTYFRANTRRSLDRLARGSGLVLEECTYVGNPFYFAFSPLLFRFALLFEKLTDLRPLQGFKLYLLATLHRPA